MSFIVWSKSLARAASDWRRRSVARNPGFVTVSINAVHYSAGPTRTIREVKKLVLWAASPTLQSGRLICGEPEFLHHLFSHPKFLDLSGHSHRELGGEFHIARNFVCCDFAAAV